MLRRDFFTYPPLDPELVCFVLMLHHEQRMVKQEHQQLSAIALRAATALQGSFVNHLTTLFLQPQILVGEISRHLIFVCSHAPPVHPDGTQVAAPVAAN